ncbi:hypothetical protein FPANT_2398 [Fusarium pseudoanthophilum]|uniref:Uncharacterized protein n=1 Tax=Fusarium pseudoanthophilum TaxID=48495 RepID=A0A8H5PQ41_9HYPO|nr:hypothetical protein FPANT_2398 [Fusarium pseudoanthophilum]
MSMLRTIATTLAEFAYDKDIKFTSFTTSEETPCFLCLITIHRDARLLCVAKDSANPVCLCCQDSNEKCGSIPREILGAAQFYWNHVRRLQTLAADLDGLTTTEQAVAEQISDPFKLSTSEHDVVWTIETQDAAATRELLSLQLLQSAGLLSREELQARVAAATPLYARDDSKAVRLRKALHRLPNAHKIPHGPDDEELEDLPQELADHLIAQMKEARDSGCTAPVCPPAFTGMEPVSRRYYPVTAMTQGRR